MKPRPIHTELIVVAMLLLLGGAAGAIVELRQSELDHVVGSWSAVLVLMAASVSWILSRWERLEWVAMSVAIAVLTFVGLNLTRLGLKWWPAGADIRPLVAFSEGVLCIGRAGLIWFERREKSGDLPAGLAFVLTGVVMLLWPGKRIMFASDALIAAAGAGGLVLAGCIIAAALDGLARGRTRVWLGRSVVAGAALASIAIAGRWWGFLGPDGASAMDRVDFFMTPMPTTPATGEPVRVPPEAPDAGVDETAMPEPEEAIVLPALPPAGVVSTDPARTIDEQPAVAQTPVPEAPAAPREPETPGVADPAATAIRPPVEHAEEQAAHPVARPTVEEVSPAPAPAASRAEPAMTRANRLLLRFHRSQPTLGGSGE